MNDFEQTIGDISPGGLFAADIETIQINIGLTCNLACRHCHVESTPKRTEQMGWETLEAVLAVADQVDAGLVDITGGAPEMNPHFCQFVSAVRRQGRQVQVRTNLTILLVEGYTDRAAFMHDQGVTLVASLPCYLQENVDKQRGRGVYHESIEVIRQLNDLGYGKEEGSELVLVYNPIGPVLPPEQSKLETDYRRELKERFGIVFNKLFTITNMPIGRFQSDLQRKHEDQAYLQLLRESYNPETVEGLMCRHLISVGWDGTLYDCDFNLALHWQVNHGLPQNIRDFDAEAISSRRILTGQHCYGCTAGSGSSCGGALV